MTDILHESTINELRDLLAEDFVDLIETYLSDTRPKLAELRQALSRGPDFDVLEKVSHSLKGSSGNIGAREMFEVCNQLVQACRADEPVADAAAQVDAIESAFGRLEPMLKAYI